MLSPDYFSPYSKELMQSEIPLNFILSKTKQLKNNRQKKRYDDSQLQKSQSRISTIQTQKSVGRSKTPTMSKDDKIRMILTGGKQASPTKTTRKSDKKKDIYAFYKN